MRAIKFRAWHRELRLMGEVLNLPFDGSFMEVDLGTQEKPYLTDPLEEFELMQYTGLKDKNGVEVYEADICKVSVNGLSWTVDFHCGEFYLKYEVAQGHTATSSLYGHTCYDDLEVIGNVYENPELLEAEK